jgi:hypothetical protein
LQAGFEPTDLFPEVLQLHNEINSAPACGEDEWRIGFRVNDEISLMSRHCLANPQAKSISLRTRLNLLFSCGCDHACSASAALSLGYY